MNRLITHSLAALLTLSVTPTAVHALLTSGSVSNLSGTRNIPYSRPASVTLRWSMQRYGAAGNPGPTVSSQSGLFTNAAGDISLGTVYKVLSKSKPIVLRSTTFTFIETVRVPRDVLFRAFQQNIQEIYYRRSFTDCPGIDCSVDLSPTLAASFTLAGSNTSVFGISRLALRFEDGSAGTAIPQRQKLRAEARIDVTGTGTLKGIWEVAGPASTAGTPFYKSLQMVNRQVSSGQTIHLLSPPLPATQLGSHLVRFRLLEPGLSEEPPVLQYMVVQEQLPSLPTFKTTAPGEGASINHTSQFQWQTVDNAGSYKLEVVARMPEDSSHMVTPVTGILIKGNINKGRLTRSLMENLTPGRTYWWHVLALDKDGNVIATTDWKRIKIAR